MSWSPFDSCGKHWHSPLCVCCAWGCLQCFLQFCLCRFSAASEKKIGWAFRIFDNWQKAQNLRTKLAGRDDQIHGVLEDMDDSSLCETLCKFILEVRKVSRELYPHETLYSLVIMIQMYLETKGRHVRFLDPQSMTFIKVRNTLDNRMKALSREGFITAKSKAEVITYSQEDKMWADNILGNHTHERLLYTVLHLLGVQFALRAGEEHKSLKFGKQLSIETDSDSGDEFLQYVEFTAKNNQGGLDAMKCTGKTLHCYPFVNPSRCLVNLYKKYVVARPIKNPKCSVDFYLRPLAKFNSEGIGFSCQPLGIHKIECAIKNLCLEAGIKGKRTNYSLRATSATQLYKAELDEQLIQERTGHRSSAVRGYKCTSSNLQKKVCNTLYGPSQNQNVSDTQDTVVPLVLTPVQSSNPPVSESQSNSNTPLRDSPEGQRIETLLNAANLTLRQALGAPVSSLDNDLLTSIVSFVRAHGRPLQSESNSNQPLNLHLHFHL